MAGGGMWHKTLVYFGLADEDDEYYDDETLVHAARRRVDVPGAGRACRRIESHSSKRRSAADFDDIFAEDDYRSSPSRPSSSHSAHAAGAGRARAAREQPQVRVHLVMPKNFNDAQIIADKFKGDIPVILNLQQSETELAKRLIDFASGLTYALDGGMQRVADKVFLLTPKNVEVSAEERQRLLEKGFFNQF